MMFCEGCRRASLVGMKLVAIIPTGLPLCIVGLSTHGGRIQDDFLRLSSTRASEASNKAKGRQQGFQPVIIPIKLSVIESAFT